MDKLLINLAMSVFNSKAVCRTYSTAKEAINKFNILKSKIDDRSQFKMYSDSELVPFQTVTSDDLKIIGKYYKNTKIKSDNWIVLIHGYTQSKEDSLANGSYFAQLGFNIISFDLRNHGESDDALVSFGVQEQKDLISVLDYVKNELGAKTIGLSGWSLGAYTVNLFSLTADDLIKKYNVIFGISDSTFIDIEPTLEKVALYKFPHVHLTKEVCRGVMDYYKSEYKINTDLLNAYNIELPKETFPILYMHGKRDVITDPNDSANFIKLRSKIKKEKNDDLVYFDNAFHIQSFRMNVEQYVANVRNFISGIKFKY